ncbi:Thioredoxin domain-containing protein [Psidium guajava]|nr:Thioredoxin domain-containing protein [Psidium guajava]
MAFAASSSQPPPQACHYARYHATITPATMSSSCHLS